jgi:hydroxyacylglutathione hydrolase
MKTWSTTSGYKIARILHGRSNVFLLTNGNVNILIDTSTSRLWNKLQKHLEESGIHRIDYLILTHTHFDHAGNARAVKEKFGSKIIVHRSEEMNLTHGDNILIKGTTLLTRPIVKIFGKRFLIAFKYDSCRYDLPVDSFFDLKDIGFNAYIMHTPGHTTGSISVIVDNEIAIVGDIMFGVFKRSVFPPFATDPAQMIKSWRKLLDTHCSVFLPSHGSQNSRQLVLNDYNKRKNKYFDD